jgi:hypothetical protein
MNAQQALLLTRVPSGQTAAGAAAARAEAARATKARRDAKAMAMREDPVRREVKELGVLEVAGAAPPAYIPRLQLVCLGLGYELGRPRTNREPAIFVGHRSVNAQVRNLR